MKKKIRKRVILGSSNLESKSQKFKLPEEISASNLQGVVITVNKKRWRLVDTLKNSTQRDRHYIVQRDENSMVYIQFGDGINGARLPSGKDNVTATYRAGAGNDGNIKKRATKRKYIVKKARIK